MPDVKQNSEQRRLAACGSTFDDCRTGKTPWKKWGPYLSERQWGTVREDYSDNGDAWNYFTHDHVPSRAYRWGEDGLEVFATTIRCSVLHWPSGTAKTPYLKSVCSACPTPPPM